MFNLLISIDSLIVNGESTEHKVCKIQNPTGICVEYRMKKIYPAPPHLDADNHFSGENVMDLLGQKGYGTTMTNHHDCFPNGLRPYLHHDKVEPGCPKAKAMHYAMPIVAIKQQPAVDELKANAKNFSVDGCGKYLQGEQPSSSDKLCF